MPQRIGLMKIYTCAELMNLPPAYEDQHGPMAKTWYELLDVEGQLATIQRLAVLLHRHRRNPAVWGIIKQAILPLVGNEARQGALRTSLAYDVAYDRLHECLETGVELDDEPDETDETDGEWEKPADEGD